MKICSSWGTFGDKKKISESSRQENGDSGSRQNTTENLSNIQSMSTESARPSRQGVIECDAEFWQGIAEPAMPLQQQVVTEPITPFFSSLIVPLNVSSLNIPEVSTTDAHVTNPDNI